MVVVRVTQPLFLLLPPHPPMCSIPEKQQRTAGGPKGCFLEKLPRCSSGAWGKLTGWVAFVGPLPRGKALGWTG